MAKRICESLRQAGVEVWFDQSELRGGDAWDAKIRKQIRECALFVPIISANTQARPEGYFRLEWRLADQRTHLMGKSKAFLLPVCIDATRDGDADVPDSFLTAQWTRLAGMDDCGAFAQRVQHLLRADLGARASSPATSSDAGGTPALPSNPKLKTQNSKPTGLPAAKGIAVLAFANLSHDPENEYFSDGISEELLNVLTKVPGLRVTARTSSFHFKGRNLPIRQIAQELGVAHVVEGSVRKAGNRVRITAQLIDAIEDAHLWSDTFDRELKDIFALQDEIAGLIAQNLQLRMGSSRRAAKTVNPEAYRLCLEGRRAAVTLSEEGLARAEALFTGALEIDPRFAVALADLAQAGLFRAILKIVAARHITAELDQTERLAREALALDPNIGEPHITLAEVALARGHMVEAEAEIRQATELSPECEHLVAVYPFIYMQAGRPDRAVVPLADARLRNPFSWLAADLHGLSLSQCGRDAEALAAFARAEQLGGPPIAYANHAIALANLGRHDQSIEQARHALDPAKRRGWSDGFVAWSDGFAARVLAQAGQRAEAEAIVRRLLQGPAQWHANAGLALALLGQTDHAFALLRDFPQQVLGCLLHFFHEAETLRNDQRCAELWRHLGATDAFDMLGRVRHAARAGGSHEPQAAEWTPARSEPGHPS